MIRAGAYHAANRGAAVIERCLGALERIGDGEAQVGLDADGAVSWRRSGREVLRDAAAWQHWLRGQGVAAGDRVAIDLPRGPDFLPAHLAALATGATVVPLNAALAAEERRRVLERASPRALADASARPRAPATARLALAERRHPALLIFTSGTTGEPKGVPHPESSLEANLADLAQVWGLSGRDRLLHALPAHHVHGLVLALYGCVRAGIAVVWLPRFDTELCRKALAGQRISVFMGVPTMYHRLAEAPGPVELPHARLFVCGSAPLAAADFAAFERRYGQAPLERYGLTETLIVSSNPLGERRAGSVGFPLPSVELRLGDDGEILVRGPSVMPGYWNAPEANAAAFGADGFFRTGDLGELDREGRLRVSGRKKELIIVGGSNVLPGEVEHALAAEPGVDEIAAAGLPDPDRGEVVGVWVVAHAGSAPRELEQRLRERAERALAAYKQPRAYRFVASLPRNAMGKLDRKALRP
jgi:malonyl-CoA/methylmalonyl-CoA synthetase